MGAWSLLSMTWSDVGWGEQRDPSTSKKISGSTACGAQGFGGNEPVAVETE